MFSLHCSEPEAQIIEYKTQQYKLLPGLAMAYATKVTSDCVWRMFKETQMSIAAGDFTMLPEVRRYLMSSKLNRADNQFLLLLMAATTVVKIWNSSFAQLLAT